MTMHTFMAFQGYMFFKSLFDDCAVKLQGLKPRLILKGWQSRSSFENLYGHFLDLINSKKNRDRQFSYDYTQPLNFSLDAFTRLENYLLVFS